MTTIQFYEKPGCINNTKQKKMLEDAGHELVVHNLLTSGWTKASLKPFFEGKPVDQWFNRSAPAVKNGEVIPEKVSADQALDLMLKDPLLIRRPLMQADGRCESGFDAERVESWVGLQGQRVSDDIENCPRDNTNE